MNDLIYDKHNIKLWQGDTLEVLKNMPDESVDMVMTSPPYWTQRFYGGHLKEIGLEETSEEYLYNLLMVCKEIKRILKKEGTFWLNIDDVYYGSGHGKADTLKGSKQGTVKGMADMGVRNFFNEQRNRKHPIIKKKDLCLIPERLIIELQKDGWYIRSKIIWHKPNAMPENVKDRPTNDYEFLFLLTKSYNYYFSLQREPHKPESLVRIKKPWHGKLCKGHSLGSLKNGDMHKMCHPEGRNFRTIWSINTQGTKYNHVAKFPEELCIKPILAGCPEDGIILDPFCGSGTTGVVAIKLGRKFWGIDLNQEYLTKICIPRIEREVGLF